MSTRLTDEELLRKYQPKPPSVFGLLTTVVLGLVVFVYIFGAILSRDFLWFWPEFTKQPKQILLNCYGDQISLDTTSPHISGIATLVNEQLSGDKRWDQLTLHDPEYYRVDPRVINLELIYDAPVRIHSSRIFFSNIETLLIPLDGNYADTFPVFGMKKELPSPGALHIATNQPLVDYLAQNGLCVKR